MPNAAVLNSAIQKENLERSVNVEKDLLTEAINAEAGHEKENLSQKLVTQFKNSQLNTMASFDSQFKTNKTFKENMKSITSTAASRLEALDFPSNKGKLTRLS